MPSHTTVPGMTPEMMAAMQKRSSLILVLGILLIIFGVIALIFYFYATVFFVITLGAGMIVGGVFAIVSAFSRKEGRWWLVVLGILALIFGVLVLYNPFGAALTLTLIVGIWLTIQGIFSIIMGFAAPPGSRGYVIASGFIGLLLGILIWANWPFSSAYTFGIFGGIGMMMIGFSLIGIAMAARSKAPAPPAAAA